MFSLLFDIQIQKINIFNEDEIKQIVQQICSKVIGQQKYSNNIQILSETLQSEIMAALSQKEYDIKYLVSIIITQKCGCGINSSVTAFYDQTTDGYVVTKYENNDLECYVTVFGLIINK